MGQVVKMRRSPWCASSWPPSLSPPAFGAVAKVASCPPGKRPNIQTLHGMFTVHVVCDRVMFEIPPEDAQPGHPGQHRVRGAVHRHRFRGAGLRRGQPRHPPGQAGQQGVPGGRALRDLGARAQTNLQRGVEAASLRTVLRAFDIIREGKGGAPIIDITGILVERGAGGLRAGPDAPVPHAHGRPAPLLHPDGEGLPAEHRHPFLPDLGARPGRAVQARRRREAHDLARLHLPHQPAPPARAAHAGALLGRPRGLLRRALRRLRHRGARQGEARATSSASAWRRRTSTPRCPSR